MPAVKIAPYEKLVATHLDDFKVERCSIHKTKVGKQPAKTNR
jgi:hypothetical protein